MYSIRWWVSWHMSFIRAKLAIAHFCKYFAVTLFLFLFYTQHHTIFDTNHISIDL
jgi:hypothetical protein